MHMPRSEIGACGEQKNKPTDDVLYQNKIQPMRAS